MSPSIVENIEGSAHSESVIQLSNNIISNTNKLGLQKNNFLPVNDESNMFHGRRRRSVAGSELEY